MQARGPLMIEHRLVERMLSLIKDALGQIESTQKLDPLFVDTAGDFIHICADRTHHGKKEDILFRDLGRRPLSAEDKRVMNELIQEHVFAHGTTKALVEPNNRYRSVDASALADIAGKLPTLVEFYPQRIEKEDQLNEEDLIAYCGGYCGTCARWCGYPSSRISLLLWLNGGMI